MEWLTNAKKKKMTFSLADIDKPNENCEKYSQNFTFYPILHLIQSLVK